MTKLPTQQFVVRVRAIIIHDNKLLVVRHQPSATHCALPGGHMEWGESPSEALVRELQEELGVTASIGRLLYVYTYLTTQSHSLEFFFEVMNGADFLTLHPSSATHSHEIAEVYWMTAQDETLLLPARLTEDFRTGTLLHNQPIFFSS